jgi:hypothetical protein
MPYIEQSRRKELDNGGKAETQGELNYKITMLLLDYMEYAGLSYGNINSVVGALECSKLEFYTKVARPYEEGKSRQNGPIY